jgi:hypothetical protein
MSLAVIVYNLKRLMNVLGRPREAAQAAVSAPGHVLHVVADAGYSNGERAVFCTTTRSLG